MIMILSYELSISLEVQIRLAVPDTDSHVTCSNKYDFYELHAAALIVIICPDLLNFIVNATLQSRASRNHSFTTKVVDCNVCSLSSFTSQFNHQSA